MRVLGLDPTFRQAMGWCLLDDRQPLDWGQIDVTKLSDRSIDVTTRFLAAALLHLLSTHKPDVVVIEKPIANSGMVARAMEAGPGRPAVSRVTGGFAATIDLAWIAGSLTGVIIGFDPAIQIVMVNPTSVKKQSGGSNTADKNFVRDQARMIFAEALYQRGVISDHTQCKRPKEHESDALFVGLEGAVQAEQQRLYAMANY